MHKCFLLCTCRKLNDTAFTTVSPKWRKGCKKLADIFPINRMRVWLCLQTVLYNQYKQFLRSSTEQHAGFDSWDHIGRLNDHERSFQHRESLSKYAAKCETIDRFIIDSYARENSYWKEVLRRVVSVVTFLVTRGLALRGSNEVFGSEHNGYYLGYLELLC